ncbi:toxin-antitoxin system YwqK family antitoxin [Flavobacterium psychrophilum]|uniref:toxin-antitoxin system YwqK family antitoxin n=1 Tax=Flavobacterium psychrophilum TaxID=96345 RepID=UPI000B7C4CF4|nr:hypothetical protein [Flavobacterium psychrophilum]SNA73660.1 conserved hypothetical protein [Flavobacterium psychrophilum]
MENKKKGLVFFIILLVITTGVIFYFYNKNPSIYTLKDYDPKTKNTWEYEYVIKKGDTILEGKFFRYNDKKIKIAEGSYLNNHLKGEFISYYDNGKIKIKHYVINNKLNAETTEYYSNGKIKRYIMFDPFGLEAFIARYDEQGNIKNYEGYPIMEIYQYPIAHKERFKIKTNQYLKVNDTLKYSYLLANIPNAKRSLFLESASYNKLNDKEAMKSVSITQTDYKEILSKKGINKVKAIVQYKFDNKEKTVINDTINFDVEVH